MSSRLGGYRTRVPYFQVDDPAAEIGASATNILEAFLEALPRIGIALAVLVVGVLASRGVRSLSQRYLAKSKSKSFATVISKMVGWVVVVVTLLLAVTVVLPSVRPVDVLASLGFFSIAVGFAFQDILENLLAGVLLLFREPFASGDQIEVNGYSGTVQRITIRETEIRTYTGRKVLIPNSDVYKNALVIQTAYNAIRADFILGVAYEADLGEARRLIEETLEGVDGVLADPNLKPCSESWERQRSTSRSGCGASRTNTRR